MTTKPRKTTVAKADTSPAEPFECVVDGCTESEFEEGRGLCMAHFTTRLDLREVARHD